MSASQGRRVEAGVAVGPAQEGKGAHVGLWERGRAEAGRAKNWANRPEWREKREREKNFLFF